MTGSTLYLTGQQFADFNFSTLDNFGYQGTYVLINAQNISGTLGANVTGSIAGRDASLAISGGQLLLDVVPEPSAWVLWATAGLALWGFSRKKSKENGNLLAAEPHRFRTGATQCD